MVLIKNPITGADISSNYCERGKEIYKETTERVDGLEIKVNKVTNSIPFNLRVGESVALPEHMANWALQTFEFLQVVKEGVEGVEESQTVEGVATEHNEVALEKTSDPAERFVELQIKGYANLKGAERDEYSKLKEELNKK